MKLTMFAFNLLVASVVSGGPAWKEVQRGGGLRIGEKGGKNISSSRGNGLKIGSSNRGLRSTTTTTTIIPEEDHIHAPTSPSERNGLITHLNIGIVVPYKSFGVREYTKAITTTKSLIARKLKLFKTHDIQVHIVMKQLTPSPTDGKLGGKVMRVFRNPYSYNSLCYELSDSEVAFWPVSSM